MEVASNDAGAERHAMPPVESLRASDHNVGALLRLLRNTLAELEREAISLERLVLQQGELLKQSGLD